MFNNLVLPVLPGYVCASIDTDVAHWFRDHLTPSLSGFLLNLSELGCALWIFSIILISVSILAWKKHWFGLAALMLTVGGGSAIGETLKLVFQRERPFLAGPAGEWGGYSFPSGHTIASTLLYGFVAVSLLPLFNRRRWRYLLVAVAGILIVGVGFSRIALGAHYLSDVLGAMMIGSAWIMLCSAGMRLLKRRLEEQPASSPENAQPAMQTVPVEIE